MGNLASLLLLHRTSERQGFLREARERELGEVRGAAETRLGPRRPGRAARFVSQGHDLETEVAVREQVAHRAQRLTESGGDPGALADGEKQLGAVPAVDRR